MNNEGIIPCICLTCGVRNDFSTDNAYCQNGHDDWLEFEDVQSKNQYFERAIKLTKMSPEELHKQFMDKNILQFKIYNSND